MQSDVLIEAESLADAILQASSDDLPSDAEYMSDSLRVPMQVLAELNPTLTEDELEKAGSEVAAAGHYFIIEE
jgi:hypothetical protein